MTPIPRTPLLLTLVLLAAAVAGCHAPDGADPATGNNGDGDDGNGAGDDNDGNNATISLRVDSGFEEFTVNAGEAFNVTVVYSVTDGPLRTSHYGAHWSNNATEDDWTTAQYAGGSPHHLPAEPHSLEGRGNYTIENWVFDTPQTVYFRPHVLSVDGTHFFSNEEFIIHVV